MIPKAEMLHKLQGIYVGCFLVLLDFPRILFFEQLLGSCILRANFMVVTKNLFFLRNKDLLGCSLASVFVNQMIVESYDNFHWMTRLSCRLFAFLFCCLYFFTLMSKLWPVDTSWCHIVITLLLSLQPRIVCRQYACYSRTSWAYLRSKTSISHTICAYDNKVKFLCSN